MIQSLSFTLSISLNSTSLIIVEDCRFFSNSILFVLKCFSILSAHKGWLEPNLKSLRPHQQSICFDNYHRYMNDHVGRLRGIHQKMLRPAETISACFGENLTHWLFSMWPESSITFSEGVNDHTWITPLSLPETTYSESGLNEHSMIEFSFWKLVNRLSSLPSNASRMTIRLSRVAHSSSFPQLLNLRTFSSEYSFVQLLKAP